MRSVNSKQGLKPKPCPNCRGTNVRRSRRQTIREWWRSFFGRFNFRCADCGHRFEQQIIDQRTFKYAYCPRCHRFDLTSWNPENYHVGLWNEIRMFFGAKPLRCDPCRCNFTSFRPRAERYQKPAPPSAARANRESPSGAGAEDGQSMGSSEPHS